MPLGHVALYHKHPVVVGNYSMTIGSKLNIVEWRSSFSSCAYILVSSVPLLYWNRVCVCVRAPSVCVCAMWVYFSISCIQFLVLLRQ